MLQPVLLTGFLFSRLRTSSVFLGQPVNLPPDWSVCPGLSSDWLDRTLRWCQWCYLLAGEQSVVM